MNSDKKMEKSSHTKDPHGGYHVPDGYFENLAATVISKAESTGVESRPGASWRSMLGFAAGFAAMVLLAVFVTRMVTPKTDVEALEPTTQTAEAALIELYEVSEDDILDYYLYEDTLSGSSQMAQAIDEYIQTYPTETPVYY